MRVSLDVQIQAANGRILITLDDESTAYSIVEARERADRLIGFARTIANNDPMKPYVMSIGHAIHFVADQVEAE